MTNREAWEEAAGYGLEDCFFEELGINPEEEVEEVFT